MAANLEAESRKFSRFAVQLPISFSGDRLEGTGMVLNLSTEGCAVRSEITVTPPTYLALRLAVFDQENPIEVELAAVRWSSSGQFGLEFIRVRPEMMERLRGFVLTLELPSQR